MKYKKVRLSSSFLIIGPFYFNVSNWICVPKFYWKHIFWCLLSLSLLTVWTSQWCQQFSKSSLFSNLTKNKIFTNFLSSLHSYCNFFTMRKGKQLIITYQNVYLKISNHGHYYQSQINCISVTMRMLTDKYELV